MQRDFARSLILIVCLVAPAWAQLPLGQVQGRVSHRHSGQPLAGVGVVLRGSGLLQPLRTQSDAQGQYLLAQVPPGDGYELELLTETGSVRLGPLRVSAYQTLLLSPRIAGGAGSARSNLAANPTLSTVVDGALLQHTPARGRTADQTQFLDPSALQVAGDVGPSFAGATGAENGYLLEGMNSGDPRFGLLGTRVHRYLVQEVQLTSAGLPPELGRSIGGLTTITLKSGGTRWHAGAYFSAAPLQAQGQALGQLNAVLAQRSQLRGEYDLGLEVSGPLWRDRLTLYLGFAPTFSSYRAQRLVRAQRFDRAIGAAALDPNFSCPGYLSDPSLCSGGALLARATTELPERVQEQDEQYNHYSWVLRLRFVPRAGHLLQLSYVGAPETASRVNLLQSPVMVGRLNEAQQIHDLSLQYAGQLLGGRLRLEGGYAVHLQALAQTPDFLNDPLVIYRATPANPLSLHDFENVPECQRRQEGTQSGPVNFNPCPVTYLAHRGFGYYEQTFLQRHQVVASVTGVFSGLGLHSLKLGGDYEELRFDHTSALTGTDADPSNSTSGHRIYETNSTGTSLRVLREYARRSGDGGLPCDSSADLRCPAELRTRTGTRNLAAYLRYNYSPSFVPGLHLDLGARWEGQQLFAHDGSQPLSILDSFAPRLGFSYDVLSRGFGRVYGSYGRRYSALPLHVNDRAFSGIGIISGPFTNTCPNNRINPGADRSVPVPNSVTGAPCALFYSGSGFDYSGVAPALKGQHLDEVVVGYQHDVGIDLVLGVAYTFRDLGEVVEDMSIDGGNYFLIGNPGRTADSALANRLDQQAQDLRTRCEIYVEEGLCRQAAAAQAQALAYRALPDAFSRPRRTYHGLQLTAQKRLSHRFALLASYSFSRSYGDYPGTYDAVTGQLDPHLSAQYDNADLLTNRSGPLPTDRPHNFKLSGFYAQPLGGRVVLNLGLTFNLLSGQPINLLGAHPGTGALEVFILPRGSAGRTPLVTQLDAQGAVAVRLGRGAQLALFADLVNVLNQQAALTVDEVYTVSSVAPMVGGTTQDLAKLRDSTGAVPRLNANFGQPTAYQAPLLLRLGARVTL